MTTNPNDFPVVYTFNGFEFRTNLPSRMLANFQTAISTDGNEIAKDYIASGFKGVVYVDGLATGSRAHNPEGPRTAELKNGQYWGVMTPGYDWIYLRTLDATGKERPAKELAVTFVHEPKHDSAWVNAVTNQLYSEYAKDYPQIASASPIERQNLLGLIEHAVIGKGVQYKQKFHSDIFTSQNVFDTEYRIDMFAAFDFFQKNGTLSSFGVGPKGTFKYETLLISEGDPAHNALDILTAPLDFVGEIFDFSWKAIQYGASLIGDAFEGLASILEQPQWHQDVGFFTGEYGITVKDMTHHGGIKEYVNSGGISVTMPEDTRYTPRMLALYGTETVRADGTMAGGIGFGATLRMIGDWLGLDGTFGMDGGFARDGEGIDTQNGGSDGDDDGGTTPATQDAIDAAVQVAIDAALTPPDQDAPILLDLDGNGIKVTDFSRSTVFMDAGNDGLEHRTAWAGRGDGVLFYDVGNDGKIEETREYVFTEWDPTARSDFEALRARFDSNNDGKLTALDDKFGMFKVMVTMADGSQEAQTLTQLGITSIDLTGDTTDIRLPDGSVITGQSTFTMNGVQMTAADVTLMAEAQGYDVRTSAVVAGSVRTTTQTAIDSDGDIAFRIVSVALADGSVTTNSYDDNGDMTFDRTQRITVEGHATLRGHRARAATRVRQRNPRKRIGLRGNPLDGITCGLTDSGNVRAGVAGGVWVGRGGRETHPTPVC